MSLAALAFFWRDIEEIFKILYSSRSFMVFAMFLILVVFSVFLNPKSAKDVFKVLFPVIKAFLILLQVFFYIYLLFFKR